MGIGVLWHLGFRNRYGVLDDSWLHRFGLPRPPSRGRSAVRRQQAGETLRPAGWAVCWGGLIQHTGQPPPFRKGRNGVKFVRHCLGVRSRKPLPLLRLTATRTGCLMTFGYIALVFLGLLVAGGLLYGASKLVKNFDRKGGPPAGED
jgi:hypothetical protein